MHNFVPLACLLVLLTKTYPLRQQSTVFRLLWRGLLLASLWCAHSIIEFHFYVERWMLTPLMSVFTISSLLTATLLHFALRLNMPRIPRWLTGLIYAPALLTFLISLSDPWWGGMLSHAHIADGQLDWGPGWWFFYDVALNVLFAFAAMAGIAYYCRKQGYSLWPLLSGTLLVCTYNLAVQALGWLEVGLDISLFGISGLLWYGYYISYVKGVRGRLFVPAQQEQTHQWQFDRQGGMLDFTVGSCEMLGCTDHQCDTWDQAKWLSLFEQRMQRVAPLPLSLKLNEQGLNQHEPSEQEQGEVVTDGNRYFHFLHIQGARGETTYQLRDVTGQYQRVAALLERQSRDPMTGLKNRAAAMRELQGYSGALCLIRTPSLVETNPMAAGLGLNSLAQQRENDTYLAVVVRRIAQVADPVAQQLYRLGQGHVLIALPNFNGGVGLSAFMQQLLVSVNRQVSLDQQQWAVNIAAGIAYCGARVSLEDGLAQAGYALAKAEAECPQRWFVADKALIAELSRTRAIESVLSEALEQKAFTPVYQGKYNLETGKLIGAEALARWRDKQLGAVTPAEFIPCLERRHQIAALDLQIIRQSLKDMSGWLQANLLDDDFVLSFNCSYHTLQQPALVQQLQGLCAKFAIPPTRLEVEITESVLGQDLKRLTPVISQLRQAGFTLALDDFSAGANSLLPLTRQQFDTLKVDKSLLEGDNSVVTSVLKCIHQLAASLQVNVVVEGIELESQRDLLQELGFEAGQGFLYARPQPRAIFEHMTLGREVSALTA